MKGIRISVLFVSFILPLFSYSQYEVKGKIVDGKTNLPLAFVSIVFNNDSRTGTTTDIDGKFYYNSEKPIEVITCSYIGYKKITLDNLQGADKKDLTIKMYSSFAELKEVVVKSGENPANRIIRQVIKNKDINNPEKIASFKYTSYNKNIYDFQPSDTIRADSIQEELDKVLQGGHLLIMESVTQRKFIAPDRNEEVIIGTKVSGLKDPPFAPLATDIQPFSFYKDIFPVMNVNYLNPISNGSLNKYQFFIEDTLYQGADTVFLISFKPRPGKNFEALTGVLYINTNKYAIQNVIAQPYEKGLISVKLQQQYQYIDNRQWFPAQLNFEIMINQLGMWSTGINANGRSYIKDVELNAPLRKRDFSPGVIMMDDSASKRDTNFWTDNRAEALQEKEQTTYRVIDSLGERMNFDKKLKFVEKVLQARVPYKFIDIDLTKTIVTNRYEGYRAGLGIITNEKFSKLISLDGFFGYGSRDKTWKYGAGFTIYLNKKREWELIGKYQNSLREAGSSSLKFFDKYNFVREFMSTNLERVQQYNFAAGFRALKYGKVYLSIDHFAAEPLFPYEYEPSAQQKITNYTNGALAVHVRYAHREKILRSGNQRMSMGTKYPILYLAYTRGIKDFYNSQFNYNKLEARIDGSFVLRNLGVTTIRLDGGFVDRPLPYGLLFTGDGSYRRLFSIIVKNYFQTAAPYEFLSDRYANLFFSHNFGSLLFSVKKFQPYIIFHQNIGWGTLSHPEYHKLIPFKTREKGYFESGLQFDNLLKVNYFNIIYIGFGMAAYYRYGPYAHHKFEDNLALKVTMNFSIK